MIVTPVKFGALCRIRRNDDRGAAHAVFPLLPLGEKMLAAQRPILDFHLLFPAGVVQSHRIGTSLFSNPGVTLDRTGSLVRVGGVMIPNHADAAGCHATTIPWNHLSQALSAKCLTYCQRHHAIGENRPKTECIWMYHFKRKSASAFVIGLFNRSLCVR